MKKALLDAFGLAARSARGRSAKSLVYPEVAKLQKQLKYADRIGVRYVHRSPGRMSAPPGR